MICRRFAEWIFIAGLGVFAGCQNPGADSSAVKQELRQREIVHLSQGQISERAVQMADSMLLQAETDFHLRLKKAPGRTSCLPALDSSLQQLQKRYPVRLEYHLFNPDAISRLKNSKEKQILDACLYSRANKLPMNPNLQKDGEKEFLYTRALTLSAPGCLTCHLNHPRPELRGKTGDTLGIKMLRLTRKQVVMSFVE